MMARMEVDCNMNKLGNERLVFIRLTHEHRSPNNDGSTLLHSTRQMR